MRAIAKLKYVLKSVLKVRVGRKHQDELELSLVRTSDEGVTASDQETHKVRTLGFEKVFNLLDINSKSIYTTDEWEKCMHQEELILHKTGTLKGLLT